ncbi:hypothetical protein [Nocardioides sp. Root190]|uniref:hypothetical protein n=1 Tax=Nocardioides sp. Root190 TaxID=1736488 RepID=UPI0012FBB263|nr:hypothetical protein [Nocardioides sp. Root190]
MRPPFAVVDHPGLLLSWRDGETGREFLVNYWVEVDNRAVTQWLTMEQVRPALTS